MNKKQRLLKLNNLIKKEPLIPEEPYGSKPKKKKEKCYQCDGTGTQGIYDCVVCLGEGVLNG